jgi:predicted site-specific integrase-resolvase
MMKKLYPSYEVITDIGSGLNFKREGLNKLLEVAVEGELEELVIAYKDRLARFGYELIENLIKRYSNGKITVVNEDEEKTPEEELVEDVLAIMNVFVAKNNGLRKYKKKLKETLLTKK